MRFTRFSILSSFKRSVIYLGIGYFVWLATPACSRQSSDETSSTKNLGGDFNISGRLSMGDNDPFQCYHLGSYTSTEKVRGRWIAGIDGLSLGSTYDAHVNVGSACGQIFTLTYNGKCENFIVADRIWENDGPGGHTYTRKDLADQKKPENMGTNKGHKQLDIAKRPFQSLFGGHNPAAGSYSINWGATCPDPSTKSTQDSNQGRRLQQAPNEIPQCPGNNQYCTGGQSFGWLAPHTNSCAAGSPGWRGNGCTCACPRNAAPQQAPQQPSSNNWYQTGSNGQESFPYCGQNVQCNQGWGWHRVNEFQCSAGSPGWKAEFQGCSCRCR